MQLAGDSEVVERAQINSKGGGWTMSQVVAVVNENYSDVIGAFGRGYAGVRAVVGHL